MLALTAITSRAQGDDLVISIDDDKKVAFATFKTDKNGNRISNSYSGDIVIPEKASNGYPVTFINHHTFEGCVNLKSVKIPSTVKFIDYQAFRNSSLTSITIPASVDSISEEVFFDMSSLTKVVIEDGPTVLHFAPGQEYGGEGQFSFKHQPVLEEAYLGRPYTTTWGEQGQLDSPLFSMSESIKKVTFGDYVTEIHADDFKRCYKLETVVFGKGIETIGEEAFSHCEKLSAIALAEGLKKIDEEAFLSCNAAKTITLPNTLKEIGWGAFKSCESVTELTIPASVTKIEDEAFLYTENLKKITFADGPDDLQIGYGMMYGGEGMFKRQPLQEAYLGRTIISDASGLFRSNGTLASATTGQYVKSLNTREFAYCDKMANITTFAIVPPTCESSTFADINKNTCKLIVPNGTVDAYKVAEGWKEFFNITGLNGISTDTEASADYFDLQGRSSSQPRKGLNIIRQDGKTRKVVVRY